MSGKSKKQKTTTEVKIPDEFKGAYGALGNAASQLTGQILAAPPTALGFNQDQYRALAAARGLGGVDSNINAAATRFRNNQGVNALRGININNERSRALSPLQRFNSNSLRATKFGDLRNFRARNLQDFDPAALRELDFEGLEATARGENLDVSNNPFLAEALANAQRITTERFTRDVQPALAAQFGGGFGLTGSSSINAQRRAAEDLSRALSEQATSTFADQFNRERQLQESARSQLANLGLSRASAIDQFGFNRSQALDQIGLSRASQLGQLGLQRAQGIDANILARNQSLGQLGLGFTQSGIQRASQLGQLQNQQAQGLLGVGQARRNQQVQRIGLLAGLGEQKRALDERRQNFPLDAQIQRLQGVGNIIGLSSGRQVTTGGGGGSAAGGLLGGALSGGALGFALGGGPIGGTLGAIGGGIAGLL